MFVCNDGTTLLLGKLCQKAACLTQQLQEVLQHRLCQVLLTQKHIERSL